MTLYAHYAIAPHDCLASQASCEPGQWNIEAQYGCDMPPCGDEPERWPGNAERYFWDVFDNVNDGETISEGASGQWWRMFRNYNHYAVGTGTYQTDELWNSNYTAVSEPDGRGVVSYVHNYSSNYGFDTTVARTLNSNPY